MSEKERKGEYGKLSRRDFLKDAGIVVGGAAVSSAFLLTACGKETVTTTAPGSTVTKTVTKGNTVPQAHICWDPLLCTGCQTCQLVCSTARRGRTSPILAAIGHFHNDFGSDRDYEPCPCLQCEEPSCLKICIYDAILIDPVLGIAVIDEEKCVGAECGRCQVACPFSPPRIFGPDPDTNTFFKCDLCHGDPLCVRWCPNGALKFKTIAEFSPEVVNGIPLESSYHLELLEERIKELSYPRGEGK